MQELVQEIKELISVHLEPKSIKETLTIEECIEVSGIGRDSILELIKKPNTDFPYFKVGKKNLVNRSLLIEWLDKVSREHRSI